MSKILKAGPDVMSTVETLIANYHPHLATILEEIAVIFKDKAPEVGGRKIPGQAKKAGPLVSCLADKEYTFVLELATDTWNEFTPDEQVALLDHLLCYLKGEEKDGGEMKWYLAKPEVAYFREEVERRGWWSTSGVRAEEFEIRNVFGPDDGPKIVQKEDRKPKSHSAFN